jgi:dihydrofolate reductase
MTISIIVAMDRSGVIGKDGVLPWHLSDDLRRFKRITLGKPIVMGRRTYESIGRPLPGRTNIVVTRRSDYRAPGCLIAASLDDAIRKADGAEELMVIGGAALYGDALGRAERIYLTEVDAEIGGDVRFPEFDRSGWCELSREHHPADERHDYGFSFVVLERAR